MVADWVKTMRAATAARIARHDAEAAERSRVFTSEYEDFLSNIFEDEKGIKHFFDWVAARDTYFRSETKQHRNRDAVSLLNRQIGELRADSAHLQEVLRSDLPSKIDRENKEALYNAYVLVLEDKVGLYRKGEEEQPKLDEDYDRSKGKMNRLERTIFILGGSDECRIMLQEFCAKHCVIDSREDVSGLKYGRVHENKTARTIIRELNGLFYLMPTSSFRL